MSNVLKYWNGWHLVGSKWLLDCEFAMQWTIDHMSKEDKITYFGKEIHSSDALDMTDRELVLHAVVELYPWIDGPDERDIRKATLRMNRSDVTPPPGGC